LTLTKKIDSNPSMSRRAILVVVVFLGVIVLANIVILAMLLSARKSSTAKLEPSNSTTASQGAPPPVAVTNTSPAGPASSAAPSSGNFAVERQLMSGGGKVRIKYLRDRQSKIRRIVVEDAAHPEASAVVSESKRAAWVLVSPDDEWIVVNERNETNGGGARLYRRSSDSSGRYVMTEGAGANVQDLLDSVWKTYLNATHADPNTPRRGVTIDATAWENDSRKLDISVAYLPSRGNPDVPEPWSCTYNVASKQVEPTPNQPAGGQEVADAAARDQNGNESDADQSSSAQNAQDSDAEVAEDDEYPGERFPATRLDELAVPDVNESSLGEITYAINEMFARHGAEFKDKKVTKEFSQFPWYQPRPGLSFDDAEKEFSDLEKENLKVLGRCRDAKLAAAKRKSRPVRGQRAEEESTAEKVMRGIRTWQDFGAPMPPHP
jgi:hypothetical protein